MDMRAYRKLKRFEFTDAEWEWLNNQSVLNELVADIIARYTLVKMNHRRLAGWRLVQRKPKT